MSWSVGTTGTKDDVTKKFADQMAVYEQMYAGKEEAADVTAIKTRGLALLAAQQVPDGKIASITAYGSHSISELGITNASCKLEVGFIDAPVPAPETTPPAPTTP